MRWIQQNNSYKIFINRVNLLYTPHHGNNGMTSQFTEVIRWVGGYAGVSAPKILKLFWGSWLCHLFAVLISNQTQPKILIIEFRVVARLYLVQRQTTKQKTN